jgi:hypothetical protein
MIVAMVGAASAQDPPGADPQVKKEFDHRVSDYLKIHKAAIGDVHKLKPTNSPAEIKHYEHQLAEHIRDGRRNARRSDILTTETCAELKRLVGITMQGPEATQIRASLGSGSQAQVPELRVGQTYPAGVPLQSTPPSLLKNLPQLPQEVEYRVVGRDLVLRDIDANMIIDYCTNIIP